MVLSYFDESGDDGFPRRSSDLFVLASVSMLDTEWKFNFQKLLAFRRELLGKYNFPVKQEFHTREFIQDKNPYHGKYAPEIRREILFRYIATLATLRLKGIVVVIDKTKIKNQKYPVLENALTYNIQRIENSLLKAADTKQQRAEQFMIITDEGRVGAMTNVSRKIQKINYIPSQYESSSTRQEIRLLVEDPLPKNSAQSYFIQAADTLAFITMLYATKHLCTNLEWANRVKRVLAEQDAVLLMEAAIPILNTKASSSNRYGIVCYPR
ncbi:DUF3800 domain-containing protein [Hymenobacter sp. BRD67]|uniref:DUF3800 domain-containing protein n=1 Tax=Hymenobacter sp. BRD67 TaxID=2675877 RepID=UPI001565C831|nr:DUF3800 domain-containing protein [Hymenobacter sp. BRD67]QKG53890.1 DUF3800 domain-containing protein [Hymenobacter sp. BRD67]